LIYKTSCRKFKGQKLLEKEIRSMKIGGVHEVKERLFRGGMLTGEATLFLMMSKGEKEKDQKRKNRSMKKGGETPRGYTLFH
jgi:hypothetical protein